MDEISEQTEIDKMIYALAKEYLLSINGVTLEMIDRHISPSHKKMGTLPELYHRLLESVQNAGMGPKVIGGTIGGLDKLAELVCDFEPKLVVEKYQGNWQKVLRDIFTILKPRGKRRETSRSLWPRFSKAIVSGADFLSRFETADDFYKWIDFFDKNDNARPALPMLLDREISGFGFPLACDFLKEIGYANFGKPDVHLKKIFTALKLSSTADDYEVFKSIVRVAKNNDVTPYNVDKLFWIIGSGSFSLDKKSIGRHRDKFISYVQIKMS